MAQCNYYVMTPAGIRKVARYYKGWRNLRKAIASALTFAQEHGESKLYVQCGGSPVTRMLVHFRCMGRRMRVRR